MAEEAPVLDLHATVHDHLEPGRPRTVARFLARHPELHPQHPRPPTRALTQSATERATELCVPLVFDTELDNGATVQLGRGSEDEVLARSERFVRTVGQVTGRFERALEHVLWFLPVIPARELYSEAGEAAANTMGGSGMERTRLRLVQQMYSWFNNQLDAELKHRVDVGRKRAAAGEDC